MAQAHEVSEAATVAAGRDRLAIGRSAATFAILTRTNLGSMSVEKKVQNKNTINYNLC